VGHFGVTRTVEAMLKAGHTWELIRSNVSDWIRECGVCQKIKHQRDPNWQDEVEHHLYSSDPLVSLSLDTLGPLPEDEDGNKYVILIMDNFIKFVCLYPTRSTTAKECVQALLQWISIFGVPKNIRTDGGSQFHNQLMEEFGSMMNFHHTIVVAYHPEANGLAERRMKEVVKHL
jgi:Integrase zinc binding domain